MRPISHPDSPAVFTTGRLHLLKRIAVMMAGSPSGGLFIAKMIAFSITFATPLILVRILTIEDYGLYKQAFLLYGTLLPILGLGLPASLLYFAVSEPRARSTYVFQTLILLSALALLGACLLFGLAYWGPQTLRMSALLPLIPPLSALLALSLLTSLFEPFLFASRAFRLVAGVHLGSEIFRAFLVVAAAGLIGGVPSILGAGIVWAGTRCLAMAACFSHLGVTLPRQFDALALSRQCKYALPYALGGIALICAEGVHLYVVAFSFPVSAFAIYSAGLLHIPVVDLTFHAVADVALVHLTKLAQERRFHDIRALILRTASQTAVPLLPLYVWLSLNAGDFIRVLFTDRFAAGIPIFEIFLLTIPLTVVGLDYVPRAFADTGFLLTVNLCRLVVAAALIMPLVFVLGLSGAAVGAVAALAFARVALMVRVSRLTGTPLRSIFPWSSLLHIGILSAALGIVTIMFTHALWATPLARLIVGTPVFVLSYVALAWPLGILNRETKEWLTTHSVAVARDPSLDV